MSIPNGSGTHDTDGSVAVAIAPPVILNGNGNGKTAGTPKPPKPPRRRSNLRFELTSKKVPRKDLMYFSRQMSVFLKAGIPILESLDAISEEMGNKNLKRTVADISTRLKSGETFAVAASAHPDAFPPFYLGVLRTAELTGTLDTTLLRLSENIERDLEARKQVTAALVYPSIIMVMAVIVVLLLSIVVLPKFEVFFESLDAKLPLVTRMLLAMTKDLQKWWHFEIGAMAVIVLLVVLGLATSRGRDIRDMLLLKAPVLGDLVRCAILVRVCRVLSTMVTAGVPLPEAMQVTVDAASNAVYRKGLIIARAAMLRGEGLAAPLAATGLFPAAARQMFRVGESAGAMDEQLEASAEYFERELDYKIKKFTALFEPIIIVFVGVIVGFVALALISAMYGIYRQVKI